MANLGQVILIDSDILVYRAAFSVETPIYVCGGGIYKRKGFAEAVAKKKGLTVKKRVNIGGEHELRKNLNAMLKQIYEDCGTRNAKLYITASKVDGNYRTSLATLMPYKGNRTASVKPFHYRKIRKILVEEYGAILVHGQEADDALAIEQIRLSKVHGSYDMSVIASIDKDLRQVPGMHYNITSRVIDYITEEEALKNFYRQILIGDATDNIPGLVRLLKIKGRDKEANSLANHHYITTFTVTTLDYSADDTYNYVLGMFEGYGFGQREIAEIGNLLWLRRYEGQIWSEDQFDEGLPKGINT